MKRCTVKDIDIYFMVSYKPGRGGPGQELISSAASFSSLPDILSGPVALWGLLS